VASGADPRWAASEPRLVAAIRDEILAAPGERITFARFMARALTEPGLGYYATSDRRPTREGDYLSAPELHPFFGRCMGRFIEAAWRGSGEPAGYLVREWGAGRGRLRETALAGLAADGSALLPHLRWELVDLPGRTEESAEPADLIVANELFDALPVHRLLQQDGTLRERWVTWRDGWFAEALGELSTPDLAARLAADGVLLRDGQRAEVCLAVEPVLGAMLGRLAPGGLLLVIDYGHDAAELYGPERMAGSLLAYRAHAAADDPFVAVGRSDLTAHVDVSALERDARQAGLLPLGRTTQARFLADLGLGELLFALGREPASQETYPEARAAVARLLDPRHLGAFWVLLWRRAAAGDGDTTPPGPLPGFRAG
jgi:SAM-dependent MidA family methyltransferase